MATKKKGKAAPKPEIRKLFKSKAEWHSWLEKNHEQTEGLWLHFGKKGTGAVTCTYDEALESALCFGWIDGQVRTHDEKTFVRKFTPRRARSIWSKVNRTKAERLIQEGQMRPAGLRAIERAKEGGEWDGAYDSSSKSTVPEDFQASLDKSKVATAFFAKLDRANRYAVLWRIQTARNTQARAKRISDLVAMLKKKETFHPWTFK